MLDMAIEVVIAERQASFKYTILLFNESNKVIFAFGRTILIGIPGNPAPEPMSITLSLSLIYS